LWGYPDFVMFRLRKLRIAVHFKNRILLWQTLFKSIRASGFRTAELGGKETFTRYGCFGLSTCVQSFGSAILPKS
jgi:hypothetical protein